MSDDFSKKELDKIAKEISSKIAFEALKEIIKGALEKVGMKIEADARGIVDMSEWMEQREEDEPRIH